MTNIKKKTDKIYFFKAKRYIFMWFSNAYHTYRITYLHSIFKFIFKWTASIYIQSKILSPPNALLYLINQMRGSQLYFEQMNNVFLQDKYIRWTTKKYEYKAWIQGWWLRETLNMFFIRWTGNNEKAPTRKYFEISSGKMWYWNL